MHKLGSLAGFGDHFIPDGIHILTKLLLYCASPLRYSWFLVSLVIFDCHQIMLFNLNIRMSDPPACKVGVGLEASTIVCALSVQMVAQMSVSFHRSFSFLSANLESKPLKCSGFNSSFLLPRPPCQIDFHQIKSLQFSKTVIPSCSRQ